MQVFAIQQVGLGDKGMKMKIKLALLAGTALLLAGVVSAQADEFKAAIGRENRNRCHMDACFPFTLTSSTLISSTRDGVFYKITYLSREDEYRPRDDGRQYDYPPIKRGKNELNTFVVFCSKTRPQLDGEALRPGDENGVFGATELIHLEYWAACHNYIATDGASPKLAKKLGYHLAPAPND
jgi:hypothetical protein